MQNYRARPEDGVAWVTGASSGIGRRLALDLARRGYAVAATARNTLKLGELADEALAAGLRIVAFPADVTDPTAMKQTTEQIVERLGPIALAVFNAGSFFTSRVELEAANFMRSYDVNVFGVINGLSPTVAHMRERGRGQIAIVGSASAYAGLPYAAAYGATKAALNYMAAALKFDLDRMNIRIQIINPGFVDTPLTEKGRVPMPALMQPEDASRRILKGLEHGGFEIAFPRRVVWPMKLLGILPYPLYFWLVGRALAKRKPSSRGTRSAGPAAARDSD